MKSKNDICPKSKFVTVTIEIKELQYSASRNWDMLVSYFIAYVFFILNIPLSHNFPTNAILLTDIFRLLLSVKPSKIM